MTTSAHSERTVYLNGAFVPDTAATVSIFDRGLLFADSVYEGFGLIDGQMIDYLRHFERLEQSLSKLEIPLPMGRDELWHVLAELIERNHASGEGFLYLQITRGVAERSYTWEPGMTPTVFAFTQPRSGPPASDGPVLRSLTTSPDLRWARRDIKTTNLLAQVMAKQHAADDGTSEGLLVKPDGEVTECGSSSFFMVNGRTVLVRPLSHEILPGVTRRTMLDLAERGEIKLEERTFTLDEVFSADEAFTTGSSTDVAPVIAVDGRAIGDGLAGPVTLRLREAYLNDLSSTFYRPES